MYKKIEQRKKKPTRNPRLPFLHPSPPPSSARPPSMATAQPRSLSSPLSAPREPDAPAQIENRDQTPLP